MSEKDRPWDVIVIGAGIGGLTAAAFLVQAGLRVLVLDKSPHPGGTAYVYHRQGFTFPMGPLGFSSPSIINGILRELGQAALQLLPVHYRIHLAGLDIPISLPFPEMIKRLGEIFPKEDAIRTVFSELEKILSAMKSPEQESNRSFLENTCRKPAFEYLSQMIQDGRLRRILGSIGTQESYSSLPLMAAMWNLMSNEKIWTPHGGMRSFCDVLVRAVVGDQGHRKGMGEIKFGAEVLEIKAEKGRVSGVRLKDESKITSPAVISNADYKTTFIKLIDETSVPDEWRQTLLHTKQTRSVLQVCLGVDRNRVDLSTFYDADRIIYRRKLNESLTDADWSVDEIDPEKLSGQELEISLWSNKDRTLGPEGAEGVILRTEAEYAHFEKYRPVWRQRLPAYQEYKARLGRALIHEAEKIIPGLEKAARITDVATPLTFEEQGGRSEGAVAGWSWDYQDCRDTLSRELIRTPIRGLYMAGYQAFSTIFMGGVPTAMESGKRAARAVLEGIGPDDRMLLQVKEE